MRLLRLILLLLLLVSRVSAQEDERVITLAEFRGRTSDKDKTVLVYFHADWCMLCAKMEPIIHKVDSLFGPRLDVISIDTRRDKEVAEAYEVDALPIFMIYREGTSQWLHLGIIGEKELIAELNKYTPAAVKQ